MKLKLAQRITVTVNMTDGRERHDIPVITSRRGMLGIARRVAKQLKLPVTQISSLVIVWVPDRDE